MVSECRPVAAVSCEQHRRCVADARPESDLHVCIQDSLKLRRLGQLLQHVVHRVYLWKLVSHCTLSFSLGLFVQTNLA